MEAERALEKAQEQLTRTQKVAAVGQLTAGVAHDFNNLLTVISHHAEFAQDSSQDSDTLREDIRQILAAGDRAKSLTQQLLAFSRRGPVAMKPTDLNELVIRMECMLKRLVSDDIVLSSRLAVDLWPAVLDEHPFQQVLLNLAVNARDAMPQGGQLTMETSNVVVSQGELEAGDGDDNIPPGEYVKVSVMDNGIGMDEHTRNRIFEPFFSTKPSDQGTGLGMSICRRLVGQAHGYMDVESSPDWGTTVSVYLPRSERAAPQEVEALPGHQLSSGSERILLVENDAAVRVPMARALRERGYDVATACDGEEAVRMGKEASPAFSLLLTDLVMPGMSGMVLAQHLTHAIAGLKVLFTTGNLGDVVARYGIADMGMSVLQKPFSPDSLAIRVREVLDCH